MGYGNIKTKNCPNCNAPYLYEQIKCPYCGTAYYDMSFLDLDGHEKFYLKLKTSEGLVIAPVFMEHMQITHSVDRDVLYADSKIAEAVHSHHTDFDLELTSAGDIIFVKEDK